MSLLVNVSVAVAGVLVANLKAIYDLSYHGLIIAFSVYLLSVISSWTIELNIHYFFLLGLVACPFVYPPYRQPQIWIAIGLLSACFMSASWYGLQDVNKDISILRLSNDGFLLLSFGFVSWVISRMQLKAKRRWKKRSVKLANVAQKRFPVHHKPAYQWDINAPVIKNMFGSVLFADLRRYTELSDGVHPIDVAASLARLYDVFDKLAFRYGMRRIKTNGDQYIAISTVNEGHSAHAKLTCMFATHLLQYARSTTSHSGKKLTLRIGISTGDFAAGNIHQSWDFDVWGHTINLASRLENSAEFFPILVCPRTYQKACSHFKFEGSVEYMLKGIGKQQCYPLHY